MGNPEISERKIANPVIPPTYNTPPPRVKDTGCKGMGMADKKIKANKNKEKGYNERNIF